MLRLNQNFIKYHIINPQIVHSPKSYKNDPKLNLYPVVGLQQIRLGALSLNLPNNQNLLTLQAMDELFRFFSTYQHDHTIENIWIENRGSTFSGGADYKQMINNQEYLDKLFKLMVLIAKLNKPTFAHLKGGVRGVSAYILSMLTVPLSDSNSSLRIDQPQRGFIPIGGGSHRLSRLPANLGIYLALTGKKLNADEMSRLGYIKGFVKEGVSNKELRYQISRSNLYFRDPIRYDGFDQIDSQVKQLRKQRQKQQLFKNYIEISQEQIFEDGQNLFTRFALNQHRIYNVFYQNQLNPNNTFTQKPGRVINNYYQLRHLKAFNTLKKKDLVQNSQYKYFRLPNQPLVKITKIFGYQTLQESIQALTNDSSQWAKQTLEQIRKKDPLAVHLTFKLLKLAQKLPWDKCLQIQYKIAKRLLNQSKLDLKETYSGSKMIYSNKFSQMKIQDIPLSEIDKYFAQADSQYKLDLQVVENSLLPNNDYSQIPDSARTYLNRIFFDDTHLRNQQKELKRFFAQQKIDYRAPNFTIDLLRQKYYQYLESQKVIQKESHRLQILLNNQEELRKFQEQRQNYVKNFPQKQLEQLINQSLKQCFSSGINQRFQEFDQTAKISGLQQKLKIFKNMKKIMMKSVVMNGQKIQNKNKSSNERFKGPIYFDKNGKNIFESTNPFVEKYQPLKQLNESIGASMEVNEQYKQKYGQTHAQKHLGASCQLFQDELQRQKVYNMILKRYKDNPREWENAWDYVELVNKASKTSEQFAGMLQWAHTDYENILLSYPKTEQTYTDKGNKISEAIKTQRQELKSQLSQIKQLNEVVVNNILTENNQMLKSSTYNLFPQAIIPSEFRYFKSILTDVIKHFEHKYSSQVLSKSKQTLGGLDNWLEQSVLNNFTQHYKWDIQFVFSYIAILKLKQILSALKINMKNIEELQAYLNNFKLQFTTNDKNQINRMMSRFLYNMLDMHTISKSKIRLPQTKLLDFFNRLKIKKQTDPKSNYPLSFQSLMILVGKDRSKIYNKIVEEYLPTQPQFLLTMANKQYKEPINRNVNDNDDLQSSFYVFQNFSSPLTKSLIAGYQYYILLFDEFIQKATGKFTFLNNTLMNADAESVRKELQDILNLNITSQEWVKQNVKKAIKNFFQMRKHYEKYLTKGQLLAFDQQNRLTFEPSIIRSVLLYKLNTQIAQTKGLFSNTRSYNTQTDNKSDKHEQMYVSIRSSIRNPDAFRRLNNYKLIQKIQRQYFADSLKKINPEQQREDLAQEAIQFQSYQRLPENTKKRWMQQIFDYPTDQKQFKQPTQQQTKKISDKLTYTDKYGLFTNKINYTDFGQQIKELRKVLKDQKTLNQLYTKIQNL